MKKNTLTKSKVVLKKTLVLQAILCALAFVNTPNLISQTIVQKHGRLNIRGNKVVNKNGEQITLAGNSLFWSSAGGFKDQGSSNYYTEQAVDILVDDWKTDIIRIPMGVKESWDGGRGYIDSPITQTFKIKNVIDAAIARGVYVVVDWHSHDAENYLAEAKFFFKTIAQLYGDKDNLIYEIYNEPVGPQDHNRKGQKEYWKNTVKPYANDIIKEIRKYDSDNLIIVGTGYYSQRVDDAADSPVYDSGDNTAYTLHFYANSHTKWLRDRADYAMNKGIPIFVTEWGAVDADGGGGFNPVETDRWLTWMKNKGISHANWAVSDKDETASIVQPGKGYSGLRDGQLTTVGKYIRRKIRNNNEGGSITRPTNQSSSRNITAGNYYLQNVATGKYLDSNGLDIDLNIKNNGAPDRQWKFIAVGNGYFNIDNKIYNRGIMDPVNIGPNRGKVKCHPTINRKNTNTDKMWKVINLYSNVYRIENKSKDLGNLRQRNNSLTCLPAPLSKHSKWRLIRVPTSKTGSKVASKTAAENKTEATKANLYPNPTKGAFTVTLDALENNTTVQVYNITGQLVHEQTVDSKSFELNGSGKLRTGVYVIKILVENVSTRTQKIIIQ